MENWPRDWVVSVIGPAGEKGAAVAKPALTVASTAHAKMPIAACCFFIIQSPSESRFNHPPQMSHMLNWPAQLCHLATGRVQRRNNLINSSNNTTEIRQESIGLRLCR